MAFSFKQNLSIMLLLAICTCLPIEQCYARTKARRSRAKQEDKVKEKRAGEADPKSTSAKPSSEAGLIAEILSLIQQCKYKEAIEPSKQLLEICQTRWGADDPVVATVMHNLAFCYQQIGDFENAEPLFLQALAIREKKLAPDDNDIALSLNNLALLYQDEGDYERAERLYNRALVIKEKCFGEDSPQYGLALNNLATLLKCKGELTRAAELLKKVLTCFEKSYGASDVRVATVLNNLAGVYREQDKCSEAEELYKRVISIDKASLPGEHLDIARDLNNIGVLYFDQTKYTEAQASLEQALAIREKLLGWQHPDLIPVLNTLALVCAARDDIESSLKYQSKSNEIGERTLAMVLRNGTEDQKRLYLNSISDQIDATVSLNVNSAPANKNALELALTTILERKGRVLDAISNQLSSVRKTLSEENKQLLDELSATRTALAQLILAESRNRNTGDFLGTVEALQTKADALESRISKSSSAFLKQSEKVRIENVQAAIPQDAALIEFAVYRSLDAKAKSRKQRFGDLRYVAYVLKHNGSPEFVDLGNSSLIDEAVFELRSALKDRKRTDFKLRARHLDSLLMQKLRKYVSDSKMLLLSPDAALNLLPFGALVDESGKFLIENYSIDYLTSGRDLQKMTISELSRAEPVIVANPFFDTASPQVKSSENSDKRIFLSAAFPTFSALPGTASEASAIAKLLPGSRLLTGKEARETSVKALSAPKILHIATHGYCMPDELCNKVGNPDSDRSITIVSNSSKSNSETFANPLMRSGLALAGANKRSSDEDDGILTALEVSGMDLWGSKLVVLSACETGLGTIRQGEGVYGLRRSFLMAGAASEVISLWPVSDQTTAFMMNDYYKRLMAGEKRIEALRQSQLKLMKMGGALSHPFYWAAFIPVGDWRPIQ